MVDGSRWQFPSLTGIVFHDRRSSSGSLIGFMVDGSRWQFPSLTGIVFHDRRFQPFLSVALIFSSLHYIPNQQQIGQICV
jgi:hypothetical protein